jgi:hypothetical protein
MNKKEILFLSGVISEEQFIESKEKGGLKHYMFFSNLKTIKDKVDIILKMNRVEQMKQIQSSALELFTKKNIDYGDAFAKYGVIGVLMRIEDKIQRSLSITKNGVNLINDEGIKDTLLDLHNYAAMALMLLEEK